VTIAEVKLWGRRIGAVSWSDEDQVGSFEYDPRFRESGIQLSPITMPLGSKIFQFPALAEEAFKGLPGMLADSLPDRYGNALIDAWLARQGEDRESFNPVERLCYVGTRAMGALEFHPEAGPGTSAGELDVASLVDLADAILSRRQAFEIDINHGEKAMNEILQVGTSAGGARAKAIVSWNPRLDLIRSGQGELEPGFSHWILKLDGVRNVQDREVGTALGYGLVEYSYHKMALLAGIQMTQCRILEENGRRHFMTKRFDRTSDGKKMHMQSLAALAHFDYNQAGAHSYEEAIEIARRLGLSREEIEEQFRRSVFNILARNQDDHVKNIAFLMDKSGGWSLSPAYDLTYSHNPEGRWTSRHQMSLNGKRENFNHKDLIQFARYCNIKTLRARRIISDVGQAVSEWPRIAEHIGVAEASAREVAENHRVDIAGDS
jgi:serine/threonine-protein kinase HipA